MSSIPTRRTARVTRSAVLTNENANARPSRTVATRTKPPSKDVAAGTTSRATAATAASRAKTAAAASKAAAIEGKADPAVSKRKRAALGEVTVANGKQKGVLADKVLAEKATEKAVEKGKAKEVIQNTVERKVFDGVVLKAKRTTTTTTTTATAASTTTITTRPAGSRRTRSGATHEPITVHVDRLQVLEDIKEEVVAKPEHHMEIDPPLPATHNRRASARKPTSARRTATRVVRSKQPELEEDDSRAPKKRRTSSEAGDEELQEVEEELKLGPTDEETAIGAAKFKLGVVEADPNGDEWDDLDAEDIDDPQMVSEYVVEIFEYLKEVEQTTMANPNYMESQKELAWKMRGILTDWLIQVHFRFRLLPETLFLAVNIIDRFLSARVVSLGKLQLVGVACMFVAAKVEEIVAPSASNFLYCADSSYTESEILQAEKYILKTLDWNLSYPNPMHFLRRISKADEYNVQVRTIGKYLMEISVLEWRLIAAPPSLLAAASIWLARIMLNREEWTPNLAHYSSYPESALIPTANLMLNYVLKPIVHTSFYKKYASKKYMKASTYVRTWAIERWDEGTRVDLLAELPGLKAYCRQANEVERQHAEAAGEDGAPADGYEQEV